MSRIKSILVAFSAVLSMLVTAPAQPAVSVDAGKRIYREGLLPSGEPLRGRLHNGVELSGAAAACAVCHRRSGLGGGEGQNTVRPIAGRLLFETPPGRTGLPPIAVENRPAYTRATLARALRDGVNPAGRKLDALMPRYALSDDEVMQLAAYLAQLEPATVPGVNGSEMHFATVIAPGVAPERERAMLSVLQAFIADKNGGTRQERRRREVGRSVIGSEQMYRGYRKWQLHEWRLDGPPTGWPAQLENYYRQQPVFALLSGIGTGNWQPVHDFCEHNEVPCLFPNIDFPPVGAEAYSSFYFSRGRVLEAEVLARHLADSGPGASVVQVYRDDAAGRESAQALRVALQRRGHFVIDRSLAPSQPLSEAYWRQMLDAENPNNLILWLDEADLADFPVGRDAAPRLKFLYLSGSMIAHRPPLASGWRDRIRIVHPFELQDQLEPRMARMQAWLRVRNVPLADERIQANAFFAATIAGDALAHMDEIFSRDYFIERVEHMTEQSLFPSVYPRLSLGPGQRFASRGGYVAGYARDGELKPLGGWIVP